MVLKILAMYLFKFMKNEEVKFGLAPNLYPAEVIFKVAEICEQYI